ncbi:uncharacterized protein [Aegilops tauschii subsp. strangulata]|uniref:uncharacterized protein n=1 Tax=Aegilops tauschii subsp. strangulata TaxID=200361 RepID=UPI003CC8B856
MKQNENDEEIKEVKHQANKIDFYSFICPNITLNRSQLKFLGNLALTVDDSVPSVWTHEVADVDDAFRNSIRQSALQNDTQPPTARGNSRFLCHGDGDDAGRLQQLVLPGAVAGADDLVALGDARPHLALCRHLPEPERRDASPQQSTPATLSSSAATPRPAKASLEGDKARRNAAATPRPTPGLGRSGRPRQARRRRVPVCLSSSAATPRPAPAKASSKADKACRNAAATPRPITGLGWSGRRGKRAAARLWRPAVDKAGRDKFTRGHCL